MTTNCGTLLERIPKFKYSDCIIEIESPFFYEKLPQETVDDWDKYGYHWGGRRGSELDRAKLDFPITALQPCPFLSLAAAAFFTRSARST